MIGSPLQAQPELSLTPFSVVLTSKIRSGIKHFFIEDIVNAKPVREGRCDLTRAKDIGDSKRIRIVIHEVISILTIVIVYQRKAKIVLAAIAIAQVEAACP